MTDFLSGLLHCTVIFWANYCRHCQSRNNGLGFITGWRNQKPARYTHTQIHSLWTSYVLKYIKCTYVCSYVVLYTNYTKIKLHEALQIGGDIGKYMIKQLDLDTSYTSAFVDLLDCFDKKQAKLPMSDEEKGACQKKLVRTLAWLEIKLPIYWCTIVRHLLLEIIPKMDVFGAMWAFGMLTMERNHTNIKGAVRSTQVMFSLSIVHQMY